MIKARIRWCSCRLENILTLGKLLRLWFCFLLHSILFFISQTSYRTYKIISSYELARPIMGIIFLVIIVKYTVIKARGTVCLKKILQLIKSFGMDIAENLRFSMVKLAKLNVH